MLKTKRKASARTAEPRAPVGALVPWGGEEVDVDRFFAESWIDLLNRQRWLSRKLKLDTAPWVVDQNAGIIQFERKDGAMVTAPVQIIGAWNPRTEIFRWAWDHPMVVQRLRNDAERTRWFGDKHGIDELTQRWLRMDEKGAWHMTALAMKVNGSHGVYRAPTEGPVIFMTLGEPKVRK
ncbi:DUF6882 domain-containing protein [Candidatus Viadribacter manganicus]|uniref:Uncharacterized protein n=1 Tax=Candidatus Viadribacter manganicus TaxID=1759059 RepID=A0A1B1AEF3_9PROT|nr:DUF6882 domain-containing protein [Candidatus Viadribacter manganicus]ANP44944.1 hypothetical protein ATE48_02890 [Candidatus Viadribacter manganicus]